MNILSYMETHGHEQLALWTDPDAGLRAFIAVHDTTLGPSLGGVRVWKHPSEEAALMDVLRLSEGMTYKSAAAGLHFGGGKGLILADRSQKTEAMMRSFGRFVESLGGRYITTEDVGMASQDLEWIAQSTRHVTGLPVSQGGSGDTSPMTGYGIYMAMLACAKERWGVDSLSGLTIALQGFGAVARALVKSLGEHKAEVKLVITDIGEAALEQARKLKNATVVAPDEIYDATCDIFAPCALGGVLNDDTIPRLQCSVVCGAANNQLLAQEHGDALQKRGILYAPDYITNAGGVINISCEVGAAYSEQAAQEKTARIYDTMQRVIAVAKKEGITTARAADRIAEERIASVRKLRPVYMG